MRRGPCKDIASGNADGTQRLIVPRPSATPRYRDVLPNLSKKSMHIRILFEKTKKKVHSLLAITLEQSNECCPKYFIEDCVDNGIDC